MNRGLRLLTVLSLGAAPFLSACSGGDNGQIKASGTVEATDADLGFQMAGRIESVDVREGDAVQAGQEVAFLDQEELLARRSSAEAQGRAAQALLGEMVLNPFHQNLQ